MFKLCILQTEETAEDSADGEKTDAVKEEPKAEDKEDNAEKEDDQAEKEAEGEELNLEEEPKKSLLDSIKNFKPPKERVIYYYIK